MIYRTIQKNNQGAYLIRALVACNTYGEFYHTEIFYGYTKRYSVKLFNDSLKKQGLKYAK